MADVSYGPKVYMAQGGDDLIVASGGELTVESGGAAAVESGGSLDIESGGSFKLAGTAVTSTAAELNLIDNADRIVKVARVALAAADTGGGVFAWANDESTSIIVQRVVLDVTTAATGACTVDVGTTATNATTSSDNLIDGLDVNAATGVFDNITDKGSTVNRAKKLASANG